MEPISTISQAADLVLKFLPFLNQHRRARSTAVEEALVAICQAVDETRLHLAALRDSGSGEHRPARELATLWQSAAMKIRPIDLDLARRLRLKAEYWTDPSHMTDEQVEQARIRLTDIAARARVMIQAT
jgi:hypothetical protein